MAAGEEIREIVIAEHARARWAQRCRDKRPAAKVEADMREEILCALTVPGALRNSKPKAFRLYKRSGRLARGTLFLLAPDGKVGWIVKSTAERLFVVTTLIRVSR